MWTVRAAALERQREAHRRDLTVAWHVAVLHRQKKIPPLEALLGKLGSPRAAQTVTQQRAMLSILSEMYGGPLVPEDHLARKTRRPNGQ